VVISGYLTAGALSEPDDKLGLAGFTALGLMRGTAQHDFQQIYDGLEANGASLGIDGGTHTSGFYGNALTEDLDLLTGTLAEVLRQPVFPPEQVERLRDQLLTGLAIRAQDTAEMHHSPLMNWSTPGTPTSARKTDTPIRFVPSGVKTWLHSMKVIMAQREW
jgi:zinc protease